MADVNAIAISRQFAGIGDWLMALQCANLVNEQYPNVEIYVSWDTPREKLPSFVREAWAFSTVNYIDDRPPPPDARHTGHLVYGPEPDRGFMPSMLQSLKQRTGLVNLDWRPQWPVFDIDLPVRRGRHVCMIGQGKKRRAGGKDPGFEYFNDLAGLLSKHVTVVQLGAADDAKLTGADTSRLGLGFDEVAAAMMSASLFVGIENGLMILAGFLGVPQVTLYNGRGHPQRATFDKHTKIAQAIHPEDACTRIMARL